MYTIKFGTDGWRAIIAQEFTVQNVKRIAEGTALWMKKTNQNPTIVIGHDCRFGGEMFMHNAACVFASHQIKVIMADKMVSTPMISLAAKELQVGLGIIITASHNPPSYNGYKLKANFGGPSLPQDVDEVEKCIPVEEPQTDDLQSYINKGLISYKSFEDMYFDKIHATFDLPLLQQNAHKFIYDAMYGAGQDIFKRILPNATVLHGTRNPGFNGIAPEPIAKNLEEISKTMKDNSYLCGLATDGDADRIGFFDSNGAFVDSHHLILLLMRYLVETKGYSGKVVKSFSVSDKVQVLADHFGLQTITTKIGFKYICAHMVSDDVLIGAEESGGIAIKGHIPERDGIWMGIALMEYCLKTGKTVQQLIDDIYAITGSFAVERYDLHITNELKQQIIAKCEQQAYTQFGKYQVSSIEKTDGFKFRLTNGSWVMIRPSGTEPVLRVYSESENSQAAFDILDATKNVILD